MSTNKERVLQAEVNMLWAYRELRRAEDETKKAMRDYGNSLFRLEDLNLEPEEFQRRLSEFKESKERMHRLLSGEHLEEPRAALAHAVRILRVTCFTANLEKTRTA